LDTSIKSRFFEIFNHILDRASFFGRFDVTFSETVEAIVALCLTATINVTLFENITNIVTFLTCSNTSSIWLRQSRDGGGEETKNREGAHI
jgi:hypothetical protein